MTHLRSGRALCAMAWLTLTGDAVAGTEVAKLPFVIDHRLHARRTVRGGSLTLDDVVTGQSVLVNGDRLQLSIRTSQQGYLYLAFCSQHDTGPRVHGLSVFPSQGSIALTANVEHTIPSRANEIVLDNLPGRETIFVVVSKTELSRSDSRLADILDGARQGVASADCRSLQRAVSGSDATAGTPPSAAVRPPPNKAARAGAPAASPAPAARKPAAHRPLPVATIERGVDIVLNPELLDADDTVAMPGPGSGSAARAPGEVRHGVDAGADGIVVLRYDFLHVAPGGAAP